MTRDPMTTSQMATPTGERYDIISADTHLIDPPDLWSRLPTKYRSRAPRLVKDPKGGDAWEYLAGGTPLALGLIVNSGAWGTRYEDNEWHGLTYENIRRGAFDGRARLDEQDIDGVQCEVLFPSPRNMATLMAQEDDGFQMAAVDVYNSWLLEDFTAVDPTRLIGIAQMPALDVDTAVRKLREAKKLGFRGVVISSWPSGGPALTREDDPFWAAAEEEGMPVHIHGALPLAGKRWAGGASDQAAMNFHNESPDLFSMGGEVGSASTWIAPFILAEVFDRYPGLTMVAVEVGAGWVPHFLEHLDDHWWRNRIWTGSRLQRLPSDYFRSNWMITFIREPFTVLSRHFIGVENLMFSTDYPHHRHDWPYTRRIVADTMAGIPESERRLMTSGNAVRLYGLGTR
jgi:predicted TIM-barrel fold metal-dependent hydrolase